MASRLKAVGYWIGSRSVRDLADLYPDPALLVDPDWCTQERGSILKYLRKGKLLVHWRGLSYCRFGCGVSDSEMGSRCLTDGTWSWPQGLPHYIKQHRVRLPDAFVEHMRQQNWIVSPCTIAFDRNNIDFEEWIEWGRQQS